MTLSVIILNYNVCYFLEQCLLSVREALASIDSEIIIVDNDSRDDSAKMVAEKFPEVIWIQNKENVGFSKGNNQGVAVAKGQFVCILNPDTAVSMDTFVKVLQFAEKQSDLGAVGVKLIDGTGNYLPESKRNIPGPRVAFFKMTGINHPKFPYYANHLKPSETGSINVLVGAFMFMSKKRYEEVGGFDEDYFMYGEDIDLSYKLLKAGYQNYYYGDTTVLHYKGESTNKNKEYIKRFYDAMRIFYKKHYNRDFFHRTMVAIALLFMQIINAFRSPSHRKDARSIKQYYILSDNIGFLKKISDSTGQAIKSISKSGISDGGISHSRIIFDANYISYTQIFKVMGLLKNRGNTFRIRPEDCDFIIGSDSSNNKGEIMTF